MMEEGSEFRCWDELIPDALGIIFNHLSLEEKLTVIPRVCKSWNRAVSGPYCWQEIDIDAWSCSCQPDHLDRMLYLLITRSCGSLRKLCVSGVRKDTTFYFIAEHASSLQTLQLQRSDMSDSIIEQIAERLSSITSLDISYCSKIGTRALDSIARNCKSLVSLCRNLHPLDSSNSLYQEDEALIIATKMPNLKHLEMAYNPTTTESVLKILSACKNLELLDLRGCWDVKLDEKFLKESYPKLKVLGPFVADYYETFDWDDYSDYLDWGVGEYGDEYPSFHEDEDRLNEFELLYYDSSGYDYLGLGVHDWPESP